MGGHPLDRKWAALRVVGRLALRRLQRLHELGFLHRDVSPENILLGRARGSDEATLYLIDYEHAQKYPGGGRAAESDVGSVEWSSIRSADGGEPRPIDDVEALGWVLLHGMFGRLPWFDWLARAYKDYDWDADSKWSRVQAIRQAQLAKAERDGDQAQERDATIAKDKLGELVQEQLSQAVRERELAAARNWTASASWGRGPLLWWAGQVLGRAAWHVWQGAHVPSRLAAGEQEFWREAAVGSRARVSYSDDDVDHERYLLWPARRVRDGGPGIEDDEVWWVLSPDADVWKERLDGGDPLTGPSGARPMPNVGYPLLGARRLYKFRGRPSYEQIMTLSKGCRDVETARGQKLEQWPKYVIGDDGHRTELSAVLRAARADLAPLVDASLPSDTIWVLMEPGGGRAIGEVVHMTPTDVITGIDGLKFMGSEVSRVRRVGVGSAPALAIEQISRLRRALDALEPQVDRSVEKGVKDQLGLSTGETVGEAGSGEVVDSLNWLAGGSAGSSTTPLAAAQLDVMQRIDGQVNDIAQPMRGVGLQPPHSALRELMRGRSPYLGGPPEDVLAPYRPGLPSLPESIAEAPALRELLRGRARQYVEGQGERMLRGHENVLEALERCPRAPFSEPSPVRSRRRYGDFARDLAKRGLVSFARQVSETDRDAEDHLQAAFQAALEDVEFSVGVADVKDAFRRVRLPPRMKRLFGLPALKAGGVRLHGAMLEGKVLGYDVVIFPVPEAPPMGCAWGLRLCQSATELRCQFAPGLRDGTPLSDAGEPLVLRLAAGTAQIEHYAHVDNAGAIGQNGERVSRSLDERAQAFEAVGLHVHGREVRSDGIEVLGVVLDGQRLQTRPTAKRLWRVRQANTGLLQLRAVRGDDLRVLLGHCTCLGLAVVDASDTAVGSADCDGPIPSSRAIVGAATEAQCLEASAEAQPAAIRRRATGKRAWPAGESSSGAASESEAAVEPTRQGTLVRRVKRRRLAGAWAIEDGCERVLDQLKQRWGRQAFSEMPAEAMDARLVYFFTSLFLLGEQASTRRYVVVTVSHFYPKFGRLGADTLRPVDIVRPGGRSQHWGFLVRPLERATPDKVGEFDLSGRLGSSWLRLIGPALSEMPMLDPHKPGQDFDYPELLRKMKAACHMIQPWPVTPHQARPSGASIDRASGERAQAEVPRRRGWRPLKNMARYEESVRLGQLAQMHGPMLEAHGDQCLGEQERALRCKALLIGDGLTTIGSGLAEGRVPAWMWRGDTLSDERLGAPLERRLQAHLRRGEQSYG
ncbi:unnamed protein product [Prorocentrum cordatum]|uniref:Casein kinase I n=1 Tax=Prorocentrum cordatum TaxID=2364126 RepID=A0ABN9SI52_9DINO|nr:unnamed protein product [Polarella glacialis]